MIVTKNEFENFTINTKPDYNKFVGSTTEIVNKFQFMCNLKPSMCNIFFVTPNCSLQNDTVFLLKSNKKNFVKFNFFLE